MIVSLYLNEKTSVFQAVKGKVFQINPTKNQAKALLEWIGCQRFIYNAKVADDRYYRTFSRKALSHTGQYAPIDQSYSQYKTELSPFLKQVPSQILRNGAVRWYQAYQRFFSGQNRRPKFKSKHGRQSVLITSELFHLQQRDNGNWFLHLGTKTKPVGHIKVNNHQDIAVLPKQITISVYSGRWSLSFNTPELDVNTGEIIQYPDAQDVLDELAKYSQEELVAATNGVDRGVAIKARDSKRLISDELLNQNTQRLAQKEKKRIKYQKKLARQVRQSKGYQKTKKRIARLYKYQSDCAKNLSHQISHKLTCDKSTMIVALEDLNVKGMTKSAKGTNEKHGKNVRQKAGLNRSILKSNWGKIKEYTKQKCYQRGKLLVLVPAPYTSQECSVCGTIHSESRESQSVYACKACGHTENADANASKVIAKHAAFGVYQHFMSGQGLSTTDGNIPSKKPVEFKISRDVIKSYHAQNREAGNPHLNLLAS